MKDQASAHFRDGCHIQKNLKFQHLPVIEDVSLNGKRYKDINRLRNGYITQESTNVDIGEIVIMGGKKCNTFEGTLYKEKVRFLHLKKSQNIYFFILKLKYEEQENDLLADLSEFCMNLFYGQPRGRNIVEECILRPKVWLVKNNEEELLNMNLYQKVILLLNIYQTQKLIKKKLKKVCLRSLVNSCYHIVRGI